LLGIGYDNPYNAKELSEPKKFGIVIRLVHLRLPISN
jgi:hypothetical protein